MRAEDHSSSLSTLFEHLEEECLLAELRLRKTLGVMRIENHTTSVDEMGRCQRRPEYYSMETINSGRYWDRTSGLFGVNEALFR